MDFSEKIIYWYLQNDRNLPWRKVKNPYFIWLSEIMLQQTRVAQGIPYYLKFIKNFPTVFDLAKADESTVLKMWQGLGYYSRARNLHFTAKYIATELEGEFPNSYKELLKLKGIGDYTASAISSICFDENAAVVDGNVYRVLARFFGIETPINSTKGIKEFKEIAQNLLDKTKPGIYNQAIMDFGALLCKPQNPLCDVCPIADNCVALAKNSIKELPKKDKKIKVTNRFFNYLVIITGDEKTILSQRKGKGIWQGLYEFPLIESSETIDKITLISAKEFQDLVPNNSTITLFNSHKIVHKLSHQHINTRFWVVIAKEFSKAAISWKSINTFPVPVLIANFLNDFKAKTS